MKRLFLILIMLLAFNGGAYAIVNINTATQADLETLNGIGPAKAKAIVEYRKKNGAFKSPDELEKVKGIGPAILKKVRKDITIGDGVRKDSKPAAK